MLLQGINVKRSAVNIGFSTPFYSLGFFPNKDFMVIWRKYFHKALLRDPLQSRLCSWEVIIELQYKLLLRI